MDRLGRRKIDFQGVYEPTFVKESKIEVGACSEAGGPYESNDLPLSHDSVLFDISPVATKVSVCGLIFTVVFDLNEFPVSFPPARVHNLPVSNRLYRSACGGSVIYSQMGSVDFQNGMKASSGKTGTDPSVAKGRL